MKSIGEPSGGRIAHAALVLPGKSRAIRDDEGRRDDQIIAAAFFRGFQIRAYMRQRTTGRKAAASRSGAF